MHYVNLFIVSEEKKGRNRTKIRPIKAAQGQVYQGDKASPPCKEEDRFAAIKTKLLDIKKHLLAEAKVDLGQMISEGNSSDVLDDMDMADQTSTTTLRAAAVTKRHAQLATVDEALRRLDSKTFGKCEDCGEEIPLGRLQCMPFALRCVGCQEEIERSGAVKSMLSLEDNKAETVS